MNSIAEKFKQRLAEESEAGEFNGFPLRLRRMRAKSLFEQGLMPMFFADVYRQAQGVDPEDPNNAELERKLTAAEFDEIEKFKTLLILDCCLEPKIKTKPDDPGDVLLADIPDVIREFIYLYSQHSINFPGTTAVKKEEVVTAATLRPFLRDGKGREKSTPVSPRGTTVRQKRK